MMERKLALVAILAALDWCCWLSGPPALAACATGLTVAASPNVMSIQPGLSAPTTYTFRVDQGCAARVVSRVGRFLTPDGVALTGDIGPYANDIHIPVGGSASWTDTPYLPSEVAAAAQARGHYHVILRQVFYAEDLCCGGTITGTEELRINVSGSSSGLRPGVPVRYSPMFPERWLRQGIEPVLVPWEGRNVVLLTTSPALDGAVMERFVARLDAAWDLFRELLGAGPRLFKELNGKPTIAAVPTAQLTCGYGCGYLGSTGVEVAGFYGVDYPLMVSSPRAFSHYYFYEMGRNFWLDEIFAPAHSQFCTGFAVFMRYVCMDSLGCEDPDSAVRRAIDSAEAVLASSGLTFVQGFTMLGGMDEKTPRLRAVHPSDQPVVYASAMLKMWRELGGNDWLRRFFAFLRQCPQVGAQSADDGLAQGILWMVAASCAAERDLSPLFAERWLLPLGPGTRASLKSLDWWRSDITVRGVLAALPQAELPAALKRGY